VIVGKSLGGGAGGAGPIGGTPAGAPAGRGPPPPAGYKQGPVPQGRPAVAPPATGPAAAPPPPPSDLPSITAAQLAAAQPMEQKQMLGEVIYMRIASSQPELAGKITGMLLEMDNNELLHLLDSHEAMSAKVNEALVVLHDFTGKEEA